MATYYALQLVAVGFWWALIKAMTGKPLYSLCNGSVVTAPSWLPAWHLLRLANYKKSVFLAMPLMLILGAAAPGFLAIRIAVALAVTLYHLLETAYTSRHGEYPILYTAWGCILPAPYAQAAAFGVAIHFVLSCGAGKCLVGGPMGWCDPRTMSTYLDAYYGSTTSRPLSRRLNRLLAMPPCATAVAVATLLVECVAVPATLFLPASLRPILGTYSMVALHVGIGLGMSARVALVFLTTLPSYAFGFSCEAEVGSAAWCLAAVIGLLPTILVAFRRRLLAEDWPVTPCSLFMWNGMQAERISRLMMTGNLRIVLATREVAERGLNGLIGLPVLHHGGSGAFGMGAKTDGDAVHDAVLRVLGYTLVHAELVDAFEDVNSDAAGEGTTPEQAEHAMLCAMLRRLERWMDQERRIVETASGGRPLVRAFHVSIDGEGRVDRVLVHTE